MDTRKHAPRSRTNVQTTPNPGKLLLDATCALADISCLTDLSLLNEARDQTALFIVCVH